MIIVQQKALNQETTKPKGLLYTKYILHITLKVTGKRANKLHYHNSTTQKQSKKQLENKQIHKYANFINRTYLHTFKARELRIRTVWRMRNGQIAR